jgi:hypothetical protein
MSEAEQQLQQLLLLDAAEQQYLQVGLTQMLVPTAATAH